MATTASPDWGKELLWDLAGLVVITVVAGISPGWSHAMLVLAFILLFLALISSPVINKKG